MSSISPNTPALSLTDDALLHELTECTNDCHAALQSGDYAAAYQCLLHRAPLIQEAAARKLTLSEQLSQRITREAAMQQTVSVAMQAVEDKIGELRQAKHKASHYKTPPTQTGIVTRGFA